MILQALTSLYEALAPKGEVPKEGWSREKISFALGIDENGDLLRITPLFKPGDMPKEKKKEEPQKMMVPIKVGNKSPKFLWGNSGFILGAANDKTPEKAKECFERNRQFHHQLLDKVDSPAAKAILNFFDGWEPEKTTENELVAQYASELLGSANMVFRFNGKFVHEIPELSAAWQTHYGAAQTEKEQCLITGMLDAIPETHPLIKGIQGAQLSGAALVSFNESAFCSYKKKQNQNAPVGKYAAFAYTTALNHLLEDRKNVHRIGDASVVCWAENADKQ